MSDLPIGWIKTPLDTVVEILDSRRIPINIQEREKRIAGKKQEKLYPYYGATGQAGYVDDYIFDEPLILLGEDGVPFLDVTRPKAYLVDGKCWVNNHAHVLKAIDGLSDRRYLCAFLNTYDYTEKITGTTRLKLTQEAMRTIQISLAPFSEQKRIAEKLDTLLARVDSCQSHLENVPQILNRFRQSVLFNATSGLLTKDWRISKGRKDHNSETKSFGLIDAEPFGNYQFPISWNIARLSDIAEIKSGVTKNIRKQDLTDKKVPYLRVANVQRGYFDLSEIKTIRVPKQRLKDLFLKPGDILFNEGGDLDKLGRGWVWSGEIKQCVFQNHVFRARLKDNKFVPKFFSYYGNSRGYDYFLKYGKQTTNLASINRAILEALPVVIPPADEQREIVRRIEKLFAYADRIETHYQTICELIKQFRTSLLSKTFHGNLVEQDPNDEPAGYLIQRVLEMRKLEEAKKNAEPRKKKEKKMSITKKRQPLYETLMASKGARLTPDQLFSASGYEASFREGNNNQEVLDAFYEELRSEIKKRRIREERPNKNTVYLIGAKS